MVVKLLPLMRPRPLEAAFARRRGQTITTGQFLQDVAALAALLPSRRRVANLCQDRYRFAVGFAAALTLGQTTLLPPSEHPGQLAEVLGEDDEVYGLLDGEHPVPIPIFRYPASLCSTSETVPQILAEQIAALLYTSGSTGKPKAHPRSWGLLVASANAAADAFGADRLTGASLIGTVPHQHSYGLESLVMLALQHAMVLHAERPFYPGDIREQLACAPRPRILVTTPVHLRVLLAEDTPTPAADLVLCATAPLQVELATAAEAAFAAPVHEIYGCSEVGQIAERRTIETDVWRCLDGIALHEKAGAVWAGGASVDVEIPLADVVSLLDDQRFRLLGRGADVVNIAGKRSSLGYLNAQLNAIDGVVDGVFLLADEAAGHATARLVAFAVAPGTSANAILAGLRDRVDAAFLPRRLHLVDTLPRNALGKLTRDGMGRLLADASAK